MEIYTWKFDCGANMYVNHMYEYKAQPYLQLGCSRQIKPIRLIVEDVATVGERSGPRLNIKTVLSKYGDFHVKDKTAVRTSYL